MMLSHSAKVFCAWFKCRPVIFPKLLWLALALPAWPLNCPCSSPGRLPGGSFRRMIVKASSKASSMDIVTSGGFLGVIS